jgi:hypothetical protein
MGHHETCPCKSVQSLYSGKFNLRSWKTQCRFMCHHRRRSGYVFDDMAVWDPFGSGSTVLPGCIFTGNHLKISYLWKTLDPLKRFCSLHSCLQPQIRRRRRWISTLARALPNHARTASPPHAAFQSRPRILRFFFFFLTVKTVGEAPTVWFLYIKDKQNKGSPHIYKGWEDQPKGT